MGSTSADNKVHKEMIANLIQITEDRVSRHVASEASVMTSIAQRVDPKLKIKASIEYAPYSTFMLPRHSRNFD
jgi:hypothetical protein